MNVCDAFNSTLKTFLEELVACSPPCAATTKAQTLLATFDIVTAADPSHVATEFMRAASPHASRITSRDPTVFDDIVLAGVELKTAWDVNEDPDTRNAIWQYLQMLLLLGSGAIMPKETRDMIEATAAGTMAKIQSGELDFGSLLGSLGGLGGDPQAMMSLLGSDVPKLS